LRGGDLVAVQGFGGLGHLGVQFARHWDSVCRDRAAGAKRKSLQIFGRDPSNRAAAEDAAAVLQRMGGAESDSATGTSGGAMGPLVSGLQPTAG